MGTIYLVRHGQASFGSKNYDQLSELGLQQSILLGEYFARTGIQFDTVLAGTLQRHAQTWHGITQGLKNKTHFNAHLSAMHHTALNEYDSDAIIRTLPEDDLELTSGTEKSVSIPAYFRKLRTGLELWMNGATQPAGMPSYKAFERDIMEVLTQLQQSNIANALIISSGGPITTAIGHILGVMAPNRIALNLQLRNSSISELQFSSRRISLNTFNTLPHLNPIEHAPLITHA